ncbi:hypothetical protein PSENEW3_00001225 [Picochlorum sp. SENEW3]|nr:hypothetical protein PSENEW3_00001225 [Picochlorum sp. SENEW3]
MGSSLVSLNSVAEKLDNHIDEAWSRDVQAQIRHTCSKYDSLPEDERFEMYLDYVLHSDIRHYWKGYSSSQKPWFVQIEHVQDISQPVKSRFVDSQSKKRMLKLALFDGKQHHVAIEHKPLSMPWPKLGAKMVLDDAVVVQGGMFLLTPATCGYLGGGVEEFGASQSALEKVLQEPMYGRRGPPLRLEEYMKMVEDKVAVACRAGGIQERERQETAPRGQEQQQPVEDEQRARPGPNNLGEEEIQEQEEYVIDSDSDANIDIDEIVRQKRSSREMDDVIVVDEILPRGSNEHDGGTERPHGSGSPTADTRDPVRDSFAGTFEALKRRRAMRQSGA